MALGISLANLRQIYINAGLPVWKAIVEGGLIEGKTAIRHFGLLWERALGTERLVCNKVLDVCGCVDGLILGSIPSPPP